MTLDRFSWRLAAGSVAFALVVASGGGILVTVGFCLVIAAPALIEYRLRLRFEPPGRRACRLRSARRLATRQAALRATLKRRSLPKPPS